MPLLNVTFSILFIRVFNLPVGVTLFDFPTPTHLNWRIIPCLC